MASDETLANYVKQLEAENTALEQQKAALIQEFREALPEKFTAADIRQYLRENILPEAYKQYVFLMNNAESEAVRAGLIKFAFQYIKDAEGKGAESDDNLKELLANLAEMPD